MSQLYIATVFAGALVCLLASVLLFLRRNSGERSRLILAVIVFFSVFNYIPRFIALYNGETPEFVVTVKMLLQAIFMVNAYVMYAVEVVSPGWLSFRRILKLYSFWVLLLAIYLVSLAAGVKYSQYGSVIEMFNQVYRFEVWFRLVLCILIFMPALFLFFVRRIRIYNNTNHIWVIKYTITLVVNIIAYILVLLFNNTIVHTLYYYISVGCSLYIVYMELFDRLIVSSGSLTAEVAGIKGYKDGSLIEKLDSYMANHQAWRDPDLSLNMLAAELCTNRTTLSKVLREYGYGSYTNYINKLRIEDFLTQAESGNYANFQESFFIAGFRSRSTAFRNFRQYAGMTPSEYFQKRE